MDMRRVANVLAWAQKVHEHLWGEEGEPRRASSLAVSPLEAQVIIVAPDGCAALVLAGDHGGSELSASRTEALQGVLSTAAGALIRCYRTQGPVAFEEGAAQAVVVSSAGGTTTLWAGASWVQAMPPCPPRAGARLELVLEQGSAAEGRGATLGFDAPVVAWIRDGSRVFGGTLMATPEALVWSAGEVGELPEGSRLIRLGVRMQAPRDGGWALAASPQSSWEDRSGSGRAWWLMQGERMGLRVEWRGHGESLPQGERG